MGTKRTGKKGAYGVPEIVAICEECGKESAPVVGNSPAAPELTGLEKLGKSGWTYSVGFFSMLAGHQTLCPECGGAR